MLKIIINRLTSVLNIFKIANNQFQQQFAYEIRSVFCCPKKGQHLIEIKIIGKSSQSISYSAEEIAADNSFIMGFSPEDIRTITYHATCDRYERVIQEEKIKKCYEVMRSKNKGTNKTVQLKNKETNEYLVVTLHDFSNHNLIDHLESQDAYYLGYLAGQEQTLKDSIRLKIISRGQAK